MSDFLAVCYPALPIPTPHGPSTAPEFTHSAQIMQVVPMFTPCSCPTPDTWLSTTLETTCSLESLTSNSATCTVEFKGRTEKGSLCTLPRVFSKSLQCSQSFPAMRQSRAPLFCPYTSSSLPRSFPFPTHFTSTRLIHLSPFVSRGMNFSQPLELTELSTHDPTHHGNPPTMILQTSGPTLGEG